VLEGTIGEGRIHRPRGYWDLVRSDVNRLIDSSAASGIDHLWVEIHAYHGGDRGPEQAEELPVASADIEDRLPEGQPLICCVFPGAPQRERWDARIQLRDYIVADQNVLRREVPLDHLALRRSQAMTDRRQHNDARYVSYFGPSSLLGA
jgi:hypothetical protein